jgi:seryl-tRNA(Sec) selenium transferase
MTDTGNRFTRREFLGATAAASSVLALTELGCAPGAGPGAGATQAGFGGAPNTEAALSDNIYTKLLGVRPHLGAHEHISRLGGGRMAPEVIEAMAEANNYFVDMFELNVAAGQKAAELLGAEAALITSGGFSGLILGMSACLTGKDPKKIEALPLPTWPRSQCLIQTAQKFDYDRAYRTAGATIVYADTRADLQARLAEGRTAMIAILSIAERQGIFAPPFESHRAPPPSPDLVPHEELIAMGKKAGVPVLVDMASDLPPWDNLHRFLNAGADLVVLSGGKCIGGPQASGILAGRRELIEAAHMNASPNDNVGRGMKVGKEEVIGLIMALERWAKSDHQAEQARWDARARRIVSELQGIHGLTAVYAPNTAGYSDADLTWDEKVIPLNRDTLRHELAAGSPRVQVEVIVTEDKGTSIWHATARTRVLRDGEEVLVARRLREVFQNAGSV